MKIPNPGSAVSRSTQKPGNINESNTTPLILTITKIQAAGIFHTLKLYIFMLNNLHWYPTVHTCSVRVSLLHVHVVMFSMAGRILMVVLK